MRYKNCFNVTLPISLNLNPVTSCGIGWFSIISTYASVGRAAIKRIT
jgi:hypothetical protein